MFVWLRLIRTADTSIFSPLLELVQTEKLENCYFAASVAALAAAAPLEAPPDPSCPCRLLVRRPTALCAAHLALRGPPWPFGRPCRPFGPFLPSWAPYLAVLTEGSQLSTTPGYSPRVRQHPQASAYGAASVGGGSTRGWCYAPACFLCAFYSVWQPQLLRVCPSLGSSCSFLRIPVPCGAHALPVRLLWLCVPFACLEDAP
jgi:hypothetical protein